MSDAHSPIKVFCSYTPEDERFFQQLQKHLSVLTHQKRIVLWHHRRITPGADWAQTMDALVNRAAVILLLISPDFLNSDYCYGVEMQCALERQSQNEACVIPILVRPVDWENAPFKHLKVLPTDGKPISLWRSRDKAFTDVVLGVRRAIEDLIHPPEPSIPVPKIWNVPYVRNPFFTGQEALLRQLAEALKTGQSAALSQPQAISGLGGIGKTQIAIEYAYQYRQDYQTVLWVLADTRESLISGYVAIAGLLHLPERTVQDPSIVVQAVKAWLQVHNLWLLILDNADELALVGEFLPLHPDTANSLNNLAVLYNERGRDKEAEPLFRRALTIREQTLGLQHPTTAESLYSLAFLYQQQHKYEEAEPLYMRALQIWKRVLGPHHPHTQALLLHYTSLLIAMGWQVWSNESVVPHALQALRSIIVKFRSFFNRIINRIFPYQVI